MYKSREPVESHHDTRTLRVHTFAPSVTLVTGHYVPVDVVTSRRRMFILVPQVHGVITALITGYTLP